MKQNPHITPEGYFEDLKSRLNCIPQQQERVTTWQKVRPHLAMAAAFIAIVTAGTAILKSSSKTPLDYYDDADGYEIAQLMQTSSPDLFAYYEEEFTEESADYTEEDIINYLIDSGLTVESIESDETEY